jgi:uncharacterized membrane protein
VNNRFSSSHHAVIVCSYIALLLLQPVWHFLLPKPLGSALWWLGLLAMMPLIPMLRGILVGSIRSMTWAGYLLIAYGVIGVMEAWSNPPQRIPALTQTLLVVVCIYGMLRFSRESR